MDFYDVTRRVQEIRDIEYDTELVHRDEDRLHQDVLREIATNSTDQVSRGLATEALRTLDIGRTRWYA